MIYCISNFKISLSSGLFVFKRVVLASRSPSRSGVGIPVYMYSTRNVNLYMINDRIGYTHDRIG